jgi:hypothetical protein
MKDVRGHTNAESIETRDTASLFDVITHSIDWFFGLWCR